MAAYLELLPLHERADTPIMRRMLEAVAESQRGSLVEMRLPRLARKMGETHTEISHLARTAENCGWIALKMNNVGAVRDIALTESGWEIVGGKPLWMKQGEAA